MEFLEPRLALTAGPTVTAVELASTEWDDSFYDYLWSESQGLYGYAIPGGSTQEQSLPWVNLDRVYISFSEDVDVDAQDLSITGVNQTQYEVTDFFYDPQLKTARWTLSQSLGADSVLFDLDADGIDPVADLDGNALDGEWGNSSSSFNSGDGFAGGDFEFVVSPLAGDALLDGLVGYSDCYAVYYDVGMTTSSQGYDPFRDLDGSGDISTADYNYIYSHLGQSTPTADPVGLGNDAPTSMGGVSADVDNPAIDQAFSLYDLFDDNEDTDTQLTYSIVSNSNASLFDSVGINTNTGQLIVNTADSASGRAEVVVRATDSDGLSVDETFTLDVNYTNAAPTISEYSITLVDTNTYRVEGLVTDPDESTSGWIVGLSGVFDARAVIYDGGWFSFHITLPPGSTGDEYLVVEDRFGLSDTTLATVGST